MSLAGDLADPHGAFLQLYERSLGDVYGYLVAPLPQRGHRRGPDRRDVPGRGARRARRQRRRLDSLAHRHRTPQAGRPLAPRGHDNAKRSTICTGTGEAIDSNDPVEALHVHTVLSQLPSHHRAALTLRYLDGLPVEQVAAHLERSVHATESLLVRAKASYRSACPSAHDDDGGRP